MKRPTKYPTVPDTPLTRVRWRIDGLGTFRLEKGTSQLLREVDAQWTGLPRQDDDPSADWLFHDLGQWPERVERFVVVDDDLRLMAAWLDHKRPIDLINGSAYRLDYFKVRPDVQGRGLGQFVFGLIGLRAMELGASRIVFQPLPKSEAFYRAKIGATECADWNGGAALNNFQVDAEALKRLEGILDGYRIK